MNKPVRFWRPVLILTLVACGGVALTRYLVAGVIEGTVPAVGGMIWFVLALPYMLATKGFGPVVDRVAVSAGSVAGALLMSALVGLTALALSVVIWLPFYLARRRGEVLR